MEGAPQPAHRTRTLRRAAAADAAAIAHVHMRTWRRAYAGLLPAPTLARLDLPRLAARWVRRCDGPGVWVSCQEEQVVGFVEAGAGRDRSFGQRVGEVYMLYVLPEHSGKGHGRRLLRRALDELAERGAHWVQIWVLAANVPARRFYSRLGLRPDGTRRRDVFDGREVEILRYAAPLNSVWERALRGHAPLVEQRARR